jgi:hypothetical protein
MPSTGECAATALHECVKDKLLPATRDLVDLLVADSGRWEMLLDRFLRAELRGESAEIMTPVRYSVSRWTDSNGVFRSLARPLVCPADPESQPKLDPELTEAWRSRVSWVVALYKQVQELWSPVRQEFRVAATHEQAEFGGLPPVSNYHELVLSIVGAILMDLDLDQIDDELRARTSDADLRRRKLLWRPGLYPRDPIDEIRSGSLWSMFDGHLDREHAVVVERAADAAAGSAATEWSSTSWLDLDLKQQSVIRYLFGRGFGEALSMTSILDGADNVSDKGEDRQVLRGLVENLRLLGQKSERSGMRLLRVPKGFFTDGIDVHPAWAEQLRLLSG